MSSRNLVIIKVGTSVLQSGKGLDLEVIEGLAKQIALLRQSDFDCVMVSSGAVGAGQSQFPDPQTRNPVLRQQILAAIGQVELMALYRTAFSRNSLQVAQVLATKEDFRDRRHYINMRNCLRGLLNEGVLPIINENDVISLRELMFTDNDELAGLLASMLGASKLILLTNVAGILEQDPDTDEMKVIAVIEKPQDLERVSISAKSKLGRGGMQSKIAIVQKMAGLGVECFIAPGREHDVLTRLLCAGEPIGTQIIPSKGVSTVKKWLSSVEVEHTQGSVVINDGALEALQDSRSANSLLPVGISASRGKFSKGDVISICNAEKAIGLGLAAYGAKELRKILGKPQQKPLIHYNYLYLFGK